MRRESEIRGLTKRVEALEVSITELANISINNFGTIEKDIREIKEKILRTSPNNVSGVKEEIKKDAKEENSPVFFNSSFEELRSKVERSPYPYWLTDEEKIVAVRGLLIKSGWRVLPIISKTEDHPTLRAIFYKELEDLRWEIDLDTGEMKLSSFSSPRKHTSRTTLKRKTDTNLAVNFDLRNITSNFHELYSLVMREGVIKIEGPFSFNIKVRDID